MRERTPFPRELLDAVERFVALLPAEREASPLDTVLDHALITAPDARDPAVLAKLDAVAGRVLEQITATLQNNGGGSPATVTKQVLGYDDLDASGSLSPCVSAIPHSWQAMPTPYPGPDAAESAGSRGMPSGGRAARMGLMRGYPGIYVRLR